MMPTALSLDESPEVEMLLLCARSHLGGDLAARIELLLQGDIDWKYVGQKAHQHNVGPLVYKSLNAVSPEHIPRRVLDQFRKTFLVNVHRTLMLTHELLAVLDLLENSGISAIPYKGPALAASVYGDLTLRQFADLDIMLRKQDVLRARDLMVSRGYQPQFELNGIQADAHQRTKYELPLIRNPGRMMVELKWEVVDKYFSFPLDPGSLWERLQPVNLDGKEVLTFSPENTLLILCVHGTKHLWRSLRMICDVAELINGCRDLDYDWVLREAIRLGGKRMLFLGLSLAKFLLGTTLPKDMDRRGEEDPIVEKLARQVKKDLFGEPVGSTNLIEQTFFHLKARERTRDRIRYGYGVTMTTTAGDWASFPLPGLLFPLYRFIRPIRLTGKYGGRLLKDFLVQL